MRGDQYVATAFGLNLICSYDSPASTKLCPKSYGTALVKGRWSSRDEAPWITLVNL
jgi:hypothetical protein